MVKADVTNLHDRCASSTSRAAAGERVKMCPQHHIREWLRQIVIGAAVECLRLVPFAILRGEHQDRGSYAILTQSFTDEKAVEAREQDVTDNDVERVSLRKAKTFLPIPARVHLVALSAKTAKQGLAQTILILDEKDPEMLRRFSHAAVPRGVTEIQ